MKPGLREIGMSSTADDPRMWLMEVEEDLIDLIQQIVGHESVDGKKTEPLDVQAETQNLVRCYTVKKKKLE